MAGGVSWTELVMGVHDAEEGWARKAAMDLAAHLSLFCVKTLEG